VSIGLAWLVAAAAASAAPQAPTFNRDVAPIFHARCISCHRPGEAAPMALVTYADARPWARAIRTKVASREMPPWFADRTYGRELANNHSLTQDEIDTIVAWVDSGAAQGTGSPPQPPTFTEGWHNFKNRPPDVILEMAAAFEVPAEGSVPVFTVWSPSPFSEDQFIEAVELRPGAVGAVHHSDVTARALPAGTRLGRGRAWKDGPLVDFVPVYPDGRSYNELTGEGASSGAALQTEAFRTSDDYRLLFYVPGGGFQEFPPGAVKRISAGNAIAWNLHYTPTGKPEQDRHRLGLWLARTTPTHEVVTKRIGEAHIIEGREFVAGRDSAVFPAIPAFAGDWRITAITPFQEDVTLYGLWPHMHLRGKDMTFIATFPDGREEVLLHVPRYDFYWQLQYQLARPLHLPAGSTIKAIGHFDNSTGNKYNPRADAPVYWSEQSWDEMFNGWMELSVDRHVITRQAIYSLATPTNSRVSLAIGSGPPGNVYVRNADGSLVASASIGATPSFIEPWTFAQGQTIQTERAGIERGSVTVTMYDVPPDVVRAATIGGPAATIAVAQPGQNATVSFSGAVAEPLTVSVSGNTIGAVTIRVLSDEGRELSAAVSSAASFVLPPFAIASTGTHSVVVDPAGTAVGTLDVTITSARGR
jgi:hypothetical protein